MFRVLLSDGTVKELPNAVKATVENGKLVCVDATGAVVNRFEQLAVIAYGLNEVLEAAKDNAPSG